MIGRVATFAGRAVDAQLLTGDGTAVPFAGASGVLAGIHDSPEPPPAGENRPVTLSVGDCTFWLWPASFVDAQPLGSNGAIEVISEHAILVVGPQNEAWVD